MPKKIRSAYEIALERNFEETADEQEKSPFGGFFVEDRPSKILGSRADHPYGRKTNPSTEKTEQVKQKKVIPIVKAAKKQTSNGASKMNIYMNCNFTLSNKLLKIIKDGSVASLSMGPFEGNKGSGHFRLELKDGLGFEDIKDFSNTSIMLEVVDFSEDIPELGENKPVQSFGTGIAPNLGKTAVVDPKKHISYPPKSFSKQPVSEEEKEAAKKAVLKKAKNTLDSKVSSYDELVAICNNVQGIDTNPLPSKKPKNGMRFTRSEAIEYEKELLSLPRLPTGVYVKNNVGSRIEIGDISINGTNLILAPFEVFDLSRLSARIVRDSANLRSLLLSKSNFVSFANKSEYEEWVNEKSSTVFEVNSGLKTGSVDEVTESLFDVQNTGESKKIGRTSEKIEISEESAMEVTGDELDNPISFDSEETTSILKQMPKERPAGFVPVSQVAKPNLIDGKKGIRRV